MTQPSANLCKAERLHHRNVISQLFESGSKSLSAFPIRVVFMPTQRDEDTPPASILVSVPKRHVKRAVKRNNVKRQIREAYRHNKHILHQALVGQSHGLALAFIWLDKEMHPSEEVTYKVKNLLERIAEKIKQQS